jgi:hypothetical protein
VVTVDEDARYEYRRPVGMILGLVDPREQIAAEILVVGEERLKSS